MSEKLQKKFEEIVRKLLSDTKNVNKLEENWKIVREILKKFPEQFAKISRKF